MGRRLVRRGVLTAVMLVAVAAALPCSAAVAAALPRSAAAVPPLYLALGDSVPVWNGPQSYPNQVRTHIAHRVPGIVLQNLAVSGETTASMLSRQYGEALAALARNRGHVALITIDIGGNDVVGCASSDFPAPGAGSEACWSSRLATMENNVARILAGLRAAAPGVPIIGMSYYNPLLGNWLAGGVIRQTVVQDQPRLLDLNSRLTRLYGGREWTADVQGAFHATDLTTFVRSPWGSVPIAVARACTWLDISCRSGSIEGFGDDPNTAGAGVIAQTFNQRIDALCRSGDAARRWPVLCATPSRPVRGKVVHLRGTAYEFNRVHTMLAGATIRVAEYPQLGAVVRRDGRYDLTVPDHAKVTPYIVDPGYHTIYLQTFTTDGEDLANVNFQTPAEAVYKGLVALLGVPVDANGDPVGCAIVSTFNTRNVRDLSYQGFIDYGAHGVAGATASAVPALPSPVYFNDHVLPDPTQRLSSVDGGVVWTGVRTGVYTISAHSTTTRFASFVATCRPGRVVNANPPWGLHELGLPNPAGFSAAWSRSDSLSSLRLLHLPATQPIVSVRCTGRGCRFRARSYAPRGSTFDVRRAAGPLRIRPGQTLDVAVTAHRYNGVVWRWTVSRTGGPRFRPLCVPLGNTLPRARCAAS